MDSPSQPHPTPEQTSPPRTKSLTILLFALVSFSILLVTFKIGEMVGFRKAFFARELKTRTHRMPFGEPPGFFRMMVGGPNVPSPHGVIGSITRINGNTIIVQERNGLELSILVTSSTSIQTMRADATLSDIHEGDSVAVFGAPTERGHIEAKRIQILPLKP